MAQIRLLTVMSIVRFYVHTSADSRQAENKVTLCCCVRILCFMSNRVSQENKHIILLNHVYI